MEQNGEQKKNNNNEEVNGIRLDDEWCTHLLFQIGWWPMEREKGADETSFWFIHEYLLNICGYERELMEFLMDTFFSAHPKYDYTTKLRAFFSLSFCIFFVFFVVVEFYACWYL